MVTGMMLEEWAGATWGETGVNMNTAVKSCVPVTMAVASGLAGLVLVGPVFTVIFGTAHTQIMNIE